MALPCPSHTDAKPVHYLVFFLEEVKKTWHSIYAIDIC